MTPKKSLISIQLSIDSDDSSSSAYTENTVCYCMKILILLRIAALIRLGLDIAAIFISWRTVFVYLFATSAFSTFTILCVVISALLEENRKKIHISKLFLIFTLIVMTALALASTIAYFEGHFEILDEVDPTTLIALIAIAAASTVVGVLQWYLSGRTVKYFSIRDDIYTVPSGKFKWRPEILHPKEIQHQRF